MNVNTIVYRQTRCWLLELERRALRSGISLHQDRLCWAISIVVFGFLAAVRIRCFVPDYHYTVIALCLMLFLLGDWFFKSLAAFLLVAALYFASPEFYRTSCTAPHSWTVQVKAAQ